MTKETNNNEAQATEEMLNIKGWLLAGVFTVTLWAVLAALFYYLEDLIAGLFVITVLSIMMSGTYFFYSKNNQEHHNDKRNE